LLTSLVQRAVHLAQISCYDPSADAAVRQVLDILVVVASLAIPGGGEEAAFGTFSRDAGGAPSLGLRSAGNDSLSNTGSVVHPNVPDWTEGAPARGILVVGDTQIPLRSGVEGPGAFLKTLPGGQGSGLNAQIPSHVEGHTAGLMYQYGVDEAVLFINKAPCATGAMCRYNLQRILPPGSQLVVQFPNESGEVTTWLFRAGEPGWKVLP
jgi:hypothetical protein